MSDVLRPEQMPDPGFYHHYKHDPKGPVNNRAVYICGVAYNTSEDCPPHKRHQMVYLPLWRSPVYEAGKMFEVRPLGEFYQPVEIKSGLFVRRYEFITDPEVIAELSVLYRDMYSARFL